MKSIGRESVALPREVVATKTRGGRRNVLKVRVSEVELAEWKEDANRAGYADVATYVRALRTERSNVDKWRIEAAKEAARLITRFHVTDEMLRRAKEGL